MKYFLIILLGLISFLSPAQDVVIPADVARHFLEQDDKVKILASKDSVNQRIISVVNQELQIKQSIIESYKKDSLTFQAIITNKDKENQLTKEDLKAATHLIGTQKFEVSLLAGATTGLVVGSVVPAIGTFTGGVVGATVGVVIYGVKKFTNIFKSKS